MIETKYGLGFINFYPDCIIELDVENKMTKEKVFFIHFQMNNFHHALGLLYDMRLCLQRLTTSKKQKYFFRVQVDLLQVSLRKN